MAEFDVFISFKNTDENGEQTLDAKMAEELYYALKESGIKVFFSNVTISEKGESKFAQLIDKALEQSCIFVAVGTSCAHFESNWVNHEIDTFRNEMLNGNKPKEKSALISYISKDLQHKQLPLMLRNCQSFYKIDEVVDFIETKLKIIGVNSDVVQTTKIQFEIGEIILNRYEILKQIHSSGSSKIYMAFDTRMRKNVVIKCLCKSDSDEFELMKGIIESEMNVMKELNHCNIMKIYDYKVGFEELFYVMEYCENAVSLEKIVENICIPREMIGDVARQICDVLRYLHAFNPAIIYRDLKPANILYLPTGEIKLIDFGSARYYKPGKLTDTVKLGTVGYAAPEQYGGKQSDERTDIYGLGATLYHLVTGMNPTSLVTHSSYLSNVYELSNEFGISVGLSYIIGKCLRNDPEERYQSADEVLYALKTVDALTKKINLTNWYDKRNLGYKSKINNSIDRLNKKSDTFPRININEQSASSPYEMSETIVLDTDFPNVSAVDFAKKNNLKTICDSISKVCLCVCTYNDIHKSQEKAFSAFIFSQEDKQKLIDYLEILSSDLFVEFSRPFEVKPFEFLKLKLNDEAYCDFCWNGNICQIIGCDTFDVISVCSNNKEVAKISIKLKDGIKI